MRTILVNTNDGYEAINVEHIVRFNNRGIVTTNGAVICKENAEEIAALIKNAKAPDEPYIIPCPDFCYVTIDEDGNPDRVYLAEKDAEESNNDYFGVMLVG